MRETFSTPAGVELDLRVDAGEVELAAVDTAETEVEVEPLNDAARSALDRVHIGFDGRAVRVEAREPRLSIRGRAEFRVSIRCPEGARVRARLASADLTARGRLGAVEVATASGDVELDAVEGDVRLDSASGDGRVREVGGGLEFRSASGDLDVGRAGGAVKAQVVSGDVSVAELAAGATLTSVSGDLELSRVAAGPVQVSSVSGDVEIAVAPGLAVWLDIRSLSGDTVSELAAGDGPAGDERLVELRGKTVSGDVRIRRAAA